MRRAGITISMVQRAASTKTVEVDARTLLCAIKTGRWQRQIRTISRKFQRALNQTGDYKTAKRAVDADKKALPAIMFSGRFSRRANEALIEHSGLLCADLDGDSFNGELPLVREKLSQNPHVWALFVSPSGDGVKVIFRVPADASLHGDSFRAIARLVLELTGKRIDERTSPPASGPLTFFRDWGLNYVLLNRNRQKCEWKRTGYALVRRRIGLSRNCSSHQPHNGNAKMMSPPPKCESPPISGDSRKLLNRSDSATYTAHIDKQVLAMWHREAGRLALEFALTGTWNCFRALVTHVLGMRWRVMGDRA
jgi:BT4734-like, N-terminal domain